MAGGLLFRNVALLAKIEGTYATDSTPVGTTNAILVSEVTMKPMEMETVDRALIRPFLGNSEQLPTKIYNGAEFTVELAGSGTAGTAPAMGPLLRACGMSETIVASTSVAYAPVTNNMESVTLYMYLDGVLHKSLGVRGSAALAIKNNDRPTVKFSFSGIFVAVVDGTPGTVTLTTWKKPLPCNKTNTPTFTLHSYAAALDSLQIDLANEVKYRSLIGGQESVRIVDRNPKGSILMEAVKVADKNWWTAISAATTGALQLVHGLTGGNIIQVDAPNVQIHTPTYTDGDGIAMLSAQLTLVPGASGNDELVLTFK